MQNIKTHIGGDTVTLGDLAGHRATLLQGPRFVGTGPDIADQMEAWFDSGACDGFVIAATHSPGAYEDVVRLVVPELQRRGVFRERYSGTTLREHLGLDASGRDGRVPEAEPGGDTGSPDLPLRGIRVVDAATLAAGPMVATMLGEFGAEVIKVEQPGVGDPLRTWGDQKDGIGLFWKSVSRNKKCVTLDLRAADGQELFHRLLDVSDVLVVNNRPSALAQVGLDYDAVHRAHPRVVMLHISGYGARRAQERPAGLRHPGRGHERLRPRDRPARRPADPAALLPGRRRGLAVGHGRRDDGALPPRRPRRRAASWSTST